MSNHRSHHMPNQLLTENQVADYLNLSPRSLQAWRYRGGGPPFIAISRRAVRYRKDDLDQWVSSLVRTSTSDPGAEAW